MSEQQVSRSELSGAYNRVDFPGGYASTTDVEKVQWAARKAVAALQRLSLECSIASAKRRAQVDGDSAKRQKQLATELSKMRHNV